MIEQQTMDARTVACYLGISAQHAYNLFHARDFPSFQVGKRLLVRKSDFEDWLDKQRKKGVSE